jgi:hypothetical protein
MNADPQGLGKLNLCESDKTAEIDDISARLDATAHEPLAYAPLECSGKVFRAQL